jgi:membrane protein DedA with SNARE-associated domain
LLDFLLDAITDSPVTYLVICGIVFIDDWVPVAPGDTAMITAGILASNGGLTIYLVVIAGTLGGMLGDNLFYFLGRRYGPRLADRFLRGERGQELFAWSKDQLSLRGSTIIVVGRFIPAGRTVTTFACGTTSHPYGAFLVADSLAALAWATYTALLGYLGGNAFKDALWQPLLLGLGVAFALGAGAEALRRVRARPSEAD